MNNPDSDEEVVLPYIGLDGKKTSVNYWAACETGHIAWSSDYSNSYDDADRDAKKHDSEKHGGVSTASVLND